MRVYNVYTCVSSMYMYTCACIYFVVLVHAYIIKPRRGFSTAVLFVYIIVWMNCDPDITLSNTKASQLVICVLI